MSESYTQYDLEKSRLEGKSFDEIVPEIVNMVYYYAKLNYSKWEKVLKQNIKSIDDLAQDMFISLFNKRNSTLSNIERKFIKASNENLSMKYISNLIGRTVYLNTLSIVRSFKNKPVNILFEDIHTNNNTCDIEKLPILLDRSQNIDLKLSYKLFIESIPNIKFNEYLINNKILDTHTILNLISDKETIKNISLILRRKDGSKVSFKQTSNIIKEVKQLARKSYLEDNCLLESEVIYNACK